MKYKLIAIDIDGTFLNDKHNVTEGNLSAIKKAANKGIKLVICSARIPTSLKMLKKYIPGHQPIIAGNGSIILDDNHKEIYSQPLEKDIVLEIISMLKEDFEDILYSFLDNVNVYIEEVKTETINFFKTINDRLPREEGVQFCIIKDSIKYIEENHIKVLKISIYENNSLDLLQEVRKKLKKFNEIEIVGAGIAGMEISHKGANKGTSLEILAKHYGYTLGDCIAIGNDKNDLEMIKMAGVGVAVKNAKESLKQAADYVTKRDNNNNAVAEVIENFIED